jgi:hypothetical protein
MAERELFGRLRLGIQGDQRKGQSGQSGERKRAQREECALLRFGHQWAHSVLITGTQVAFSCIKL